MNINNAKLTKKETIALLAAVICGSVTDSMYHPQKYIFISRGTRKKSWIDTVLSSLSTRIDGLTPHHDRDGSLVPGAFWVSKEISDWADSYDRSSIAYREFNKMASP